MPLLNAARLINKAAEEERKEIFYRQWLVRFTNMDKETYIPFEEYYESTKPKKLDQRTTEEIMAEILRR